MVMMIYKRSLLILSFLLLGTSVQAGLPKPAALEPAVAFWTRIYTEVDTNSGLIHDAENLEVVYKRMRFSNNTSRRSRSRMIKREKKRIKTILRALSRGKRSAMSHEYKRILSLWPQGVSNRTLRRAASNVRFQLGQANKYRAGMIRSGQWRKYIHEVFSERGLPTELSLLPHVESSFNPKAYSKVGAAGLWQFTRSTGRRYLRVDHIVDERMDPYKATKAAASLLAHNYAVTGTWPLAITSYNHGAAGMRRAVHILGTTDIATIIRRYKGRTFGFASRNFYTAFLAAVEVDKNYKKHFGSLALMNPISPKIMRIPNYVPAVQLSKAMGINMDLLRAVNPALRPAVWSGSKHIPKDYHLNLPAKVSVSKKIFAAIPPRYQYKNQKRDRFYTVRRGNTLSQIARRYRTSVRTLMALNNLRSARRIHIGQRLRLPHRGRSSVPTTVASASDKTLQIASRKPVKHRTASTKSKPQKPFDGTTYKVRRGDTIYGIAKKFGVRQREILAVNDLHRRHRIYPGQKLRINAKAPVETTPKTIAMAETREKTKPRKSTPLTAEAPKLENSEAADTNTESEKPDTTAGAKTKPAKNTDSEPVESDQGDDEKAGDETAVENEIEIVKIEQIENEQVEKAEPTEEINEDVVTPGTPAASHSQLVADPSDYEVADNNTIEIQAEETLGHYAEWLDLRASRLRRVNRMRFGTQLVIGKRLKLDFSRVKPREFEQRRIAYHRAIQEDFFSLYRIDSTKKYKIRRGETLWYLTNKKFNVPVWLLRQHNPDVDFANLRPNTKIIVPVLQENETPEEKAQPQDSAKPATALIHPAMETS